MLDGLLQRMSGVLHKYGVDPRELSQEQLYKLALILQLLQAQDKTGATFKLLIKEAAWNKLEKCKLNYIFMSQHRSS